MTRSDRFDSARHPLLAAVATNTARPGALLVTLGVLTALALLVAAAASERSRYALALVVQVLVALLALVAGPVLAAQQLFADRQAGALDQHRLARRTPMEMLAAYVLGPTWVLLALMLVTLGLSALFADGKHLASLLGYGALSMAAVVAWSVGGVSLALALDRSLPLNQAGGVGVLGPILRLPVYGVMSSADRAHAVIVEAAARAAAREDRAPLAGLGASARSDELLRAIDAMLTALDRLTTSQQHFVTHAAHGLRRPALELLDDRGRGVAGGPPDAAGDRLRLALPEPLERGVYTIRYRVTSADGHPGAGTITFGIGVAPPVPDGAAEDATPAVAVAAWVVRWLNLITLLGGFGGGLFVLLAGGPRRRAVAASRSAALSCLLTALCVMLSSSAAPEQEA